MGLDLTIMPLRDLKGLDGIIVGYDRLQFDRDYRIFGQIADIDGKSTVPEEKVKVVVRTYPLPPGAKVCIYQDEGIETARENSYGEEMVYTLARELGKLKLPGNVSIKNRAIAAYVNALESDTPIILEWR